ncbi:nuclear transport factor 2 family protein [Undibacterium oligocarboniphilum]|nr:nuclear transport factor 2 family protein [Undibacterium oligocarboniphilum]
MESLMRSPGETVACQLDAYNAKQLEHFISCWAEDAEYYAHPATLLAKGRAAIRERHRQRFLEPDLHGQLISRVVLGQQVIDHEIVIRNFPEGKGHVEVVCIYQVENGLIAKAWFLMGTPVLASP